MPASSRCFGVALFQAMVYQGLRTTTAVMRSCSNSSLPLFMLLCSWALEGERATARQIAGIALAASVLAFAFWNRGVAVVGANAAGFTIHLLPAFGTALAILFLDESFAGFHAVGFLTILCGVFLATRR